MHGTVAKVRHASQNATEHEAGILTMPRWFRWLAPLCMLGSATAPFAQQGAPPSDGQILVYAVDGFALGSRVQVRGSAYRGYRCSPSDQFDGFTWCQKILQDREQRGSFTATYSILHAADGSVVYVNRYQEPAFFGPGEANDDIRSYSRQFGGTPEVTQMLPRNGLVGQIALWGNVILKVLDNDSIRILAEGKSPKQGLLIDFIGDFTSSVRAGLPIYRISGGAGFVWIASYDQRGRGTLRFAAVDVSRILPQTKIQPNAEPPQ
jgi:hypothetical protein